MPDTSFFSRLAGFPTGNPAWLTGMKLAEHQYLLDKKDRLPLTGIDSVTRNALQQVPPWTPPTLPVFGEWARGLLDLSEQVGSVFSQVENFVERMGGSMSAVANTLADTGRVIETVRASEFATGLTDMIGNLPKLPEFNRFWDHIAPGLDKLRELIEDARVGDAVLEEAEFGFADHLWNIFFMRGFAYIPPRVRSAVVTRKLATHTSSDIFVDELREEIEASQTMRRRWRVIEAALGAHASRKYDLSVPVFLAQIEGALGDAMFLKNLVAKEGNKYYLLDQTGNHRVNRNGKRLPPVTLDTALKNARLEDQAELTAASEFMSNVMVQRRNDILHGRDITYGRAKLSVQALLLLTILVRMLEELEDNGP
jgi:hypothetical protein